MKIVKGSKTNKTGRSMKMIRIILFSLLALSLTVCAGIFILLKTFDADRYLPPMTRKASLALGRPVSIAGLGLGFSGQGISLDVGPLTIADDAGFTTQPFIKVDRVRISLDLMSLIFRREIHITDILLQSPQIHFIRSLEGNINVRSIGQGSPFAGDKAAVVAGPFSGGIASDFRPRLKKLYNNDDIGPFDTIRSIKVRDASISFIDQSQGMPLDVWLLNINANLDDRSFLKAFRLSFDASPLVFKGISPGTPDSPIFKNVSGAVQLNMGHLAGDITITGGTIKHFNIIKTVLSHTLVSFGGMDGYTDKLGAQDTVIEKAEAEFSLHDKAVFIDNSSIKTNIFEFTAKGSVDQGLNTDMQTMLYLNTDVSAALVNEFGGLKFLCDDSKRIAIGASLKGVIPHLKYKLNKDFRKKSKKALMEEGGKILGVLF